MNNPTVYHAGPVPFKKISTSWSPFGLHVGTLEQAKSIGARGMFIHEIEFTPKNCLRTQDILDWAFVPTIVEELKRVGVWNSVDDDGLKLAIEDAKKRDSLFGGTPDEIVTVFGYEIVASFLRKRLLEKGYDCIVYLNRFETAGLPPLTDDVTEDRLAYTDEQFKERYPQAHDSYIILDFDAATVTRVAKIEKNPSGDVYDEKRAHMVSNILFDTKNGLGSTDYVRNISYYGFVIWLTPLEFLSLNPERVHQSSKRLIELMDEGRSFAPPYLNVQVVPNLENLETLQITGHEGRNRMQAIIDSLDSNKDTLFPVYIFIPYIRASQLVAEDLLGCVLKADTGASNPDYAVTIRGIHLLGQPYGQVGEFKYVP